MRIIDRYIGKQVLLSTFFAVVVLSVVLVLGNVFKHILRQLVERPDLELAFVAKFMLYVLPFSLSLTIPWGFLTAILLVFGRLSADNELVSLRMAGLSTPRICASVAAVGLALSSVCFWMNISVAPAARASMIQMLPNMLFNMATKNPLSLFTDQQVMDEIPRHLIWAEKTEEGLKHLQMIKMDDRLRPEIFVIAESATISADLESEEPAMVLEMHNALFELKSDPDPKRFTEAQPYVAEVAPLAISLAQLKERQEKFRPEIMQVGDIAESLASGDLDNEEASSARTEISMRYSFSIACLTLGLIGVPLGITAQRRETSIGFAMSLIVGIIYFLFFTLAELMREKDNLYPHLLVWIPNLLFLTVGVLLFRRLSSK